MLKENLIIDFNKVIDLDQMFNNLGDDIESYKKNEPGLFEFISKLKPVEDIALESDDVKFIGSSLFTDSLDYALNHAIYDNSNLQDVISSQIVDAEHYNGRGFMKFYIKYEDNWFNLETPFYTDDYSVYISKYYNIGGLVYLDSNKYNVVVNDFAIDEEHTNLTSYTNIDKLESISILEERLKKLLYQANNNTSIPDYINLNSITKELISANHIVLTIRGVGQFNIKLYEHASSTGTFLLLVDTVYFDIIELT